MARTLKVEIIGDTSDLEKSLKRASAASSGLGSKLGGLGKTAALAAGTAGLGAIAFTLKTGIDEWTNQTRVAANTAAVLKATGGIANVTAKHVQELASAIEHKSGIDDEAVKTSENLLLHFKAVRNESGAVMRSSIGPRLRSKTWPWRPARAPTRSR
jgi:hypothetical protein